MGNQDETVFVNYEKLGRSNGGAAQGNQNQSKMGATEQEKPDANRLSKELKQAYMKLGKAYYEGGFEDPLPQLLPLFDRITRLKKEEQRQKGLCPKCGKPVEESAMFCGACGCRLK